MVFVLTRVFLILVLGILEWFVIGPFLLDFNSTFLYYLGLSFNFLVLIPIGLIGKSIVNYYNK